ncbi:hypothetical protein [Thiomicrorhabdus aquaedulcis]|uniref:hypothetical protein n=1 Tax=Thiomicrorhabdus aquaedulcis TaxID=2211106 RepID=UPI000FD865D4|nr:hypothetical protein [Thiomicrorhabdus aquaedulcis]
MELQQVAKNKLSLLALSKQLVTTTEAEKWEEFSLLNRQFVELYKNLVEQNPSSLNDIMTSLLEDSRQYHLNIQNALFSLSSEHLKDVANFKKLKTYIKES